MTSSEEGHPMLKRDTKFCQEVFGVFEKGTRDDIQEKILDPRVSLALKCPEDGESLISKLLTKVTNGDKIVLEKLDACIRKTHDDPDNKDYGVAIDYRYLVDDDSRNICILRDILEVQRSATIDIMDHPVVTTFISRRWPKKMFVSMAAVYIFFVLTFTVYLLFTFSKFHDEDNPLKFLGRNCSVDDVALCRKTLGNNFVTERNCSRACLSSTPFFACQDNDAPMCGMEIVFTICAIILILQEVWQFVALKEDYLREAENWFEWAIIVLALICLFLNGKPLSLLASITILLAWVQLIFVVGRLPSTMGSFSLMYYASSKRVLVIAIGFFLMIIAFGIAFYILHFQLARGSVFQTLGKSIIVSFVWFMGGVDLDNLWDSSNEKGLQVEVIAILLLVAMMVFGTLIMFNLIVATIITDMDWLKEEAKDTALRNQAHNAVQAGVATKPFWKGDSWNAEELELQVCLHSVCGPCGKENVTEDEKSRLCVIINKGQGGVPHASIFLLFSHY